MWNRQRRAAINQAEVRKRCKLFGPMAAGHRAFQRGTPRAFNPFLKADQNAWYQGWDLAQEKQREKRLDP